jgi:hypothetical protein
VHEIARRRGIASRERVLDRGSALLVPISSGGETIAMLELLSRTATAPNAELMVSLEAIALQLSATAQLLKLADVPRWQMGRR